MKIYNLSTYKTLKIFTVAAFVLCLPSCSSDDDIPVNNPNNPEDTSAIDFGIDIEGFDSRAFVSGTEALETACTPAGTVDEASDQTERIGIIADLKYKNTTNRVEERYLNHWMYKQNGAGWKYYVEGSPNVTERKHWIRGTHMICSAYYPAKYMKKNGSITPETTTGDKLTLSYSALTNQEDLMLGYNVIDSDLRTDKDGNPLPAGKTTVVPITMQHAMSALKFQFKSPDTHSNDKLTKVWLDDTGTDTNPDYFAVVGQLTYNTVSEVKNGKTVFKKEVVWTRARSGLYQNYIWENTGGIPLTYSESATEAVMAVPYQNNYTNPEAELYSHNEGFIIIIPQKIPEDLCLCFTTQGGGSKKIIKQKLLRPNLTQWLPNTRYTYTLTLTPAGITLTVDVQPWNEIDSNTSVEID